MFEIEKSIFILTVYKLVPTNLGVNFCRTSYDSVKAPTGEKTEFHRLILFELGKEKSHDNYFLV